MRRPLLIVLLLALARLAFADGGRLRFNQPAGPFVVTLFTTPDPLTTSQADFSVAIERANTQGLVQNADVTFILTPVDHPGERLVLHASHDAATSRFLQAANFTLPGAGIWRVTVIVQQGNDVGKCSGNLDVYPASVAGSRIGMNIGLVCLLVLLFFVHQWRKRAYRLAVSLKA